MSERLRFNLLLIHNQESTRHPTVHFDALRDDLEAHHPEVVGVALLQLLLVVVEDEGQVVVQVELGEGETGEVRAGHRRRSRCWDV